MRSGSCWFQCSNSHAEKGEGAGRETDRQRRREGSRHIREEPAIETAPCDSAQQRPPRWEWGVPSRSFLGGVDAQRQWGSYQVLREGGCPDTPNSSRVACGKRHSHGSTQTALTRGAVAPGTSSRRPAGVGAFVEGLAWESTVSENRCRHTWVAWHQDCLPASDALGSRPPQLPGDLCFCPGWWRPFKCAGVVRRQQWQLHGVTLSPCPGCPGRSWPRPPPPSSCPRCWVISSARCSQKNSVNFN